MDRENLLGKVYLNKSQDVLVEKFSLNPNTIREIHVSWPNVPEKNRWPQISTQKRVLRASYLSLLGHSLCNVLILIFINISNLTREKKSFSQHNTQLKKLVTMLDEWIWTPKDFDLLVQ